MFWWVNQNQTWRHEIHGGYMWSPKRTQNDRRNEFYDNMAKVDAGHIVFAFFDQQIQYMGIVQGPAISASKPSDFGLTGDYWNNEGWYVPVEWSRLSSPIRPKQHIDTLRPYLPAKYSPLQPQTGDGLQGVYLAAVPNDMADVLLSLLGTDARAIAQEASIQGIDDQAITQIDDAVERAIINDTTIDSTEKDAVVKARRGQGRFRRNLESIEGKCRVTGVTDQRLLRASHIKPWRSCENNHERLDGYNGLLLAPHIDHLFDHGYISFEDNGRLLLSPRIARSEYEKLGIGSSVSIDVGAFTSEQARYLAHHRAKVFKSS